MRARQIAIPLALGLGVLFATALNAAAQSSQFAVGQNVVPVYEGWERNPDGSFTMVFGYMNRNLVEEPIVPLGTDNKFEPGDVDRGQPTHFYPRRQQFMFSVKVPKDWGNKELIWTITSHGKTEKAYGSLLPVWEIGLQVWQENRGAVTFTEFGIENDPPVAKLVGDAQRTVAVGEPLKLTVEVRDDARPKWTTKRRSRPPSNDPTERPKPNPVTQAVVKLDPGVTLGVTWIHHRGPAPIAFEPMRQAVTEGKATTTATFKEPGTYIVRAYADDGIYTDPVDFTVTVRRGSSSTSGGR